MGYDARLADRVRELLGDGSAVTERAMFGALGFLVDGRIAVAASNGGGLLVRVDPAGAEHLVATTGARPAEMKGRALRGWLHVDGEHVRTDRELARWIAIGTAAARDAVAT